MSHLLTPTHSRRAVQIVAYARLKGHGGDRVVFDIDFPISAFSADQLPDFVECAEIIEVVWFDEAPPA